MSIEIFCVHYVTTERYQVVKSEPGKLSFEMSTKRGKFIRKQGSSKSEVVVCRQRQGRK